MPATEFDFNSRIAYTVEPSNTENYYFIPVKFDNGQDYTCRRIIMAVKRTELEQSGCTVYTYRYIRLSGRTAFKLYIARFTKKYLSKQRERYGDQLDAARGRMRDLGYDVPDNVQSGLDETYRPVRLTADGFKSTSFDRLVIDYRLSCSADDLQLQVLVVQVDAGGSILSECREGGVIIGEQPRGQTSIADVFVNHRPGSCMAYDSCREWLSIYELNPDVCGIVYIQDHPLYDGSAAALIWNHRKPDGSDRWYMDRAYSSRSKRLVYKLLTLVCKQSGIDIEGYLYDDIDHGELQVHSPFTVNLIVGHGTLPWFDSLYRMVGFNSDPDTGERSIDMGYPGSNGREWIDCLQIQSTEGTELPTSVCPKCGEHLYNSETCPICYREVWPTGELVEISEVTAIRVCNTSGQAYVRYVKSDNLDSIIETENLVESGITPGVYGRRRICKTTAFGTLYTPYDLHHELVVNTIDGLAVEVTKAVQSRYGHWLIKSSEIYNPKFRPELSGQHIPISIADRYFTSAGYNGGYFTTETWGDALQDVVAKHTESNSLLGYRETTLASLHVHMLKSIKHDN